MVSAREGLLAVLLPALDQGLIPHGLKRRGAKSAKYVRAVGETKQFIEIVTYLNPRYEPSAQLHVYPFLEIQMPSVSNIALRMVDDELLLAGVPEITIRQPLDMAVPTAEQQRWFVYGEESRLSVARLVCISIEKWGVPFLDDYRVPADFIRGYERGDPRLLRQEHLAIHVAAAHLLLGQPREAEALLKRKLGSVGLRQRYARAFDYLDQSNH
jgi:hypothetical protein